tara:strand:- start:2368 stop:2508 length:141 start_codon:yes stop_codon:yes gene_type:complete
MHQESGRLNEVFFNISLEIPIEEVISTIINDVKFTQRMRSKTIILH